MAIPVLVTSSLPAACVSPWFFVLTLALIVGFGLWFGRGALVIGIAIPVALWRLFWHSELVVALSM